MEQRDTTNYPIDFYLDTFKPIIDQLSTSKNIAIGGYQALKLHGLILNREPKDLDIIIFQPTQLQIAALSVLICFDIIRDRPKDLKFENFKAFKFKKNDIYLDVIISNLPMENLLTFSCSAGDFKVNTIQGVIEAKASYKFRRNEETVDYANEICLYARAKDMLDFQQLKNINFNM